MIDETRPEAIGLALALIERFEHWLLPIAVDVQAKLARGESNHSAPLALRARGWG